MDRALALPLTVRRGSMLIEAAAAIALVMVAMGAVAQLVALSARQRNESEQMRIATQEAANAMERLFAMPWNELNGDAPDSMTVSKLAAEGMQEPQLRIAIEPVGSADEGLATRRIRVQISWINRAGQRIEPVQLVAWKHASEPAP